MQSLSRHRVSLRVRRVGTDMTASCETQMTLTISCFYLKLSAPLLEMPETDFKASISRNEVVVTHRSRGHVYRFPVLANGTVSLTGSRIEPNPNASREAGRFVFDAHLAARIALEQAKHT